MSFADIVTLTLVIMLLAALPSSSVVLVVARSVSAGRRHGVAVMLGIILADLIFMALAIAGMSVLAHSVGGLFGVIRVLCGLYLIWFGLSLFRISGRSAAETFTAGSRSLAASFASGFLLTLGDIKAIAFYASLLPVFIDLTTLKAIDMLVLAMITIIGVGSIKLAYVIAAGRIAIRANSTALKNTLQRSAGVAMIGTGSWLILKP